MAEIMVRARRKNTDRWMRVHRKLLTPEMLKRTLRICLGAAPGFLLALADVTAIPSGFHLAWMTALAAAGKPVKHPAAGCLLAFLLRAAWGIPFRMELLLPVLMMPLAHLAVFGRGNAAMMVFTAVAMIPSAIAGLTAPTADVCILRLASVPLCAVSTPILYRCIRSLLSDRRLDALEDRVACGYAVLLMVCGGARIQLLGVNLGMLLAGAGTLLLAQTMGTGAGVAAGMLSGMMLSLQGLPVALSTALALGGFCAGMAQAMGRRLVTCIAFAAAAVLAMAASGSAGAGCALACIAASAAVRMTAQPALERLQKMVKRFRSEPVNGGDAYAAFALRAWEKTVEAMARAVPSPVSGKEERNGLWWQEKLCDGCPVRAECGCMTTDLACRKAESVWACREANDEIWQGALEQLRGMGCARLYHIRQSMDCLRMEERAMERAVRRAQDQRDMLVTHLTAMAGAARRFAFMSCGESWWDSISAARIRKALSEAAVPVRLSFVRRIQGHAQAAFELQMITGARTQAEELRSMTETILGLPMQVTRIDEDRVQIAERPGLCCEVGTASASMDGSGCCGDTVWFGELQDGRYLAALSDGMGHGDKAALESRQTVELLRLCLDAGYSRPQTLTAVNGMMLMAGRGERFSTVDMLLIDLWNGQATVDKLGAACSWLMQRDGLTCLTGDALPLGILEEVESRSRYIQMHAGDALILMSDGVEDAFVSRTELENAVRAALDAGSAQLAADALLAAAAEHTETTQDDRTVAVLLIQRTVQDQPHDV